MKSKWFLVLAGALILLQGLSGCAPAVTDTPTPCSAANLQAPILIGPTMGEVVDSLSPSLNWSYPDPTCNPEGYTIDLKTGPLFTDDLGGGTGNPSTSWGPGSPLLPGQEYEWGVQAINGTTPGPFAGYSHFFTGPMCETATLKAPTLLQPADGSIITDLEPVLIWQYPDPCLPQGYRVILSSETIDLSGGTGNPTTRWVPGVPLADCTAYSWKVVPINDTTLGPASGTFSFSTNATGFCPTPTPLAPTPTPVPALTFLPDINANCRSNPDPYFPVLKVVTADQPYLLDGRNEGNTWYRIKFSDTVSCWISAGAGAPSGETSGLPVLVTLPIPAPTNTPVPAAPVACMWLSNPGTCAAAGCTWVWNSPAQIAGSCK